MAAFWAVFTFGGSGPALTAHGSLDLKQEIKIQIQIMVVLIAPFPPTPPYARTFFSRF
jgi:hypothetical protein